MAWALVVALVAGLVASAAPEPWTPSVRFLHRWAVVLEQVRRYRVLPSFAGDCLCFCVAIGTFR